MRPFIILALPRSRTAWLSRFLSSGDWHCGHDELRHCRSLDDVKAWFSQNQTGTVETAAAPWWRLIPRYAPNARIVVIRRPVAEVVDSLLNIEGVEFEPVALRRNMERLDRKLDQVTARLPCVWSINYDRLANEAMCAGLFEYCLGAPHDRERWKVLSAQNIQINFPALVRYANAYAPALNRLAAQAKQQILADMARRAPVTFEGMTFQSEPFDVWLRDGERLFTEHCITVGEDPNEWRRKNIALMRHLDRIGAMQIMTARSNGRLFGYLMSILSPSLVSESMVSASNTTFFAAPEFPGLGLKLQRAAIQSLKERGVGEVFFEAGKRESGERLGAMYRRLGASEHGQMFRLPLVEA